MRFKWSVSSSPGGWTEYRLKTPVGDYVVDECTGDGGPYIEVWGQPLLKRVVVKSVEEGKKRVEDALAKFDVKWSRFMRRK